MDKYRNIGLKLTPQRMAIFDYLDGNKDHPSAEEIYTAVLKRFPTMSFATVYNTLSALRDKGGVRELTIDPAKKRYDPEPGRHNHLICLACKKVVDIQIDYDLELPNSVKQDFTVFNNQVEFYGVCPGCKETNKRHLNKEGAHVLRA
jgi:Fur family transcriptional regulator, peroxide stress response regulator